MRARFVRTIWENEAKTIATLYFRPDRPYYFTAGQYAELAVPHDNPDARGVTRTMTFSSAPADKLIGITTRFMHPQSSYKQALQDLQPGAIANLTDAMGDMVLPLDSSVPLVFVAGGVGIASYVSMIKWLTETGDKRDITLLYAVRSTDDVIFQTQFDAYTAVGNVKKILFTTDNKADGFIWNGTIRKSRLTAADIIAVTKPDSQIYISGAEQMVEQLRHELQKTYEVEQYRIAFDFFDGYTASEI